MTQYEEIVKELKAHKKGRSDWDLHKLGIGRPSARISEMRKMGYVFGVIKCKMLNKYGRTVCYNKYTLEGEPDVQKH